MNESWGMENAFEAWGEIEDLLFLNEASPFETFAEAAQYSLLPTADEDEWFENLHSYLWALRRLFWLELIPTGRIRVRFTHVGERGEGVGPHTLFRSRSQSQLDTDLNSWPLEDSFVLRPHWLNRSDQLYMECLGDHLFNWTEVTARNLHQEDLDSDLFEHSFNSVDVIEIAEIDSRSEWKDLDLASQGHIVEQLAQIIFSQIELYEEVLVDPRDLLALVAAHPGTQLNLSDQVIFGNQHAIRALAE